MPQKHPPDKTMTRLSLFFGAASSSKGSGSAAACAQDTPQEIPAADKSIPAFLNILFDMRPYLSKRYCSIIPFTVAVLKLHYSRTGTEGINNEEIPLIRR